ncbi:MAG TPA: CARDB domain-containing protein [Solirubrobacterales bacterium]|nr:CARDB domain-containing protein [Solirubrobacterales bacterium]
MTKSKLPLAAGLVLVALFAMTAGANAKSSVGGLPDLVVTKVSKPGAQKALGSKLKFVATVKNKGGGAAGKSKLGLYLGKGKKHVKKDKRLKLVKVKPLAAGKQQKRKFQVVLPKKAATGQYRLFACADATKKVNEGKEANCKATRKFKLVPATTPKPAAPAFTMTDGFDWGFATNAKQESVNAGSPITLTLRTANGLAGQAGYTQSAVAPAPFLTGTTIPLNFSEQDDGIAEIALPFAFPFGGVNETSLSVGTNGWVSFGAPAWDYWDDSQPIYYRGPLVAVGEFYRGLMPYWSDLDLETAGGGTVKEVISADGKSVAIQWDIGSHQGDEAPKRAFQVVLSADGSFRFDYPGANLPGGYKSFVGFSTGSGPAAAGVVSIEGTSVPTTSVQFTPNPAQAETATAAGQISATLPFGSSLVSADPGCVLAKPPTLIDNGLVNCSVPGIFPGEQLTRHVTFAAPANAAVASEPPNFSFQGSYEAGPFTLKDGKEINSLTTSLPPLTFVLDAKYPGAAPAVGDPALFEVQYGGPTSGGFDEPTVTFSLPANAAVDGISIDGKALPCGPGSGTQVTCKLPSGSNGATIKVTVIPGSAAQGNPLTLGASFSALNAPTATDSVSTPPVTAAA